MSLDYIQYEYQEAHIKAEGGGDITPKNNTIIYLSDIPAYFLLSVDTPKDEYILTTTPLYNTKPSYQPAAVTS